jgi:hypothetical protein
LAEQLEHAQRRAQELAVENESSKELVRGLEAALESEKSSGGFNEDGSTTESLRGRLSTAEDENSRLRLKYANIERKTRRISDVTSFHSMALIITDCVREFDGDQGANSRHG